MIIDHDYILRQIAEMGEFLRRLAEETDRAQIELQLAIWTRINSGQSLFVLKKLEPETIIELTGYQQRLVAALSLCTLARLRPEDASEYGIKALRLFLSMKDNTEIARALSEQVYQLVRAGEEELTAEEMIDAALFMREGCSYAHMDSTVFFLWETLSDTARLQYESAIAGIYRPLLALTEEQLQAGGLSAQELRESINELTARS